MTLADKLCVIQDHILGMPIGVGEQQEGIYFCQQMPAISQFACIAHRLDDSDIWHVHFGHAFRLSG